MNYGISESIREAYTTEKSYISQDGEMGNLRSASKQESLNEISEDQEDEKEYMH
jgi:uncharacterized protein (UPF0147 family)